MHILIVNISKMVTNSARFVVFITAKRLYAASSAVRFACERQAFSVQLLIFYYLFMCLAVETV